MRLNLVFHNIVEVESQIDNPYTVTQKKFIEITEEIQRLISERAVEFDDFSIYFDDGYASFKDLILSVLKSELYTKTVLTIVCDDIGQPGFLNSKDLTNFKNLGIQISSHGISHSSLAMYQGDTLLPTLKGGMYSTALKGRSAQLCDMQVLYQLIESKKILETLVGVIDEFVLPYGIYNERTILLNERFSVYTFIATCDEYLDSNERLKPRVLIDAKTSVTDTLAKIKSLRKLDFGHIDKLV
jgi:Polysaccharide deacetylase